MRRLIDDPFSKKQKFELNIGNDEVLIVELSDPVPVEEETSSQSSPTSPDLNGNTGCISSFSTNFIENIFSAEEAIESADVEFPSSDDESSVELTGNKQFINLFSTDLIEYIIGTEEAIESSDDEFPSSHEEPSLELPGNKRCISSFSTNLLRSYVYMG